jgi:SAM-dependent methyltransferase
MFWKTARAAYAGVTAEDPDIRRYLEISADLQQSGNEGIVGAIHDLGHQWIAERSREGKTLEIGFGSGRHQSFFRGRSNDYFPSEYSSWHFSSDAWRAVRGRGVGADARSLPYRDASFDNVISIYNLEHIDDLQGVFAEVRRVLKSGGRFLIALPCEGGLLWNLGRELTTRRMFQKTYGINYDKAIAFEHVRDFRGVVAELRRSGLFRIGASRLLPLLVPTHHLNLIACLAATATPYQESRT